MSSELGEESRELSGEKDLSSLSRSRDYIRFVSEQEKAGADIRDVALSSQNEHEYKMSMSEHELSKIEAHSSAEQSKSRHERALLGSMSHDEANRNNESENERAINEKRSADFLFCLNK